MILNSIEIVVFSQPGLGARKSGLAEAVNRPKLTFVVSPKYLSNETKIYIFITRIPREVYIIFWGDFSNILSFPPLVDIYRHPLLRLFWSCQHNFCFRLSTLIIVTFLTSNQEPRSSSISGKIFKSRFSSLFSSKFFISLFFCNQFSAQYNNV